MPIHKTNREEIIRKSITVFRQRGYYRTNMSDLAAYCGLTKGAFYHHFKSKEEVMQNALEMTSNWFKHTIFSIAYSEEIENDKKLQELLKRYLHTFTQEKGGCFFANTILETTQVEDTFKTVMEDFFQAWQNALQHIFETKYSQKEAQEKSINLIALLEGSIVLMQLRGDSSYLKNAIANASKMY